VPDPAIYVINLDRSPDRLARMSERLDRLALAWTRIPAMDGKEFGPPPWPNHDLRGFDRRLGKPPNPNEVGCYLSHVAALKAAAASEDAVSLILEDDAEFSEDFREILDDVMARRAEWDVVTFAGLHRALPRPNAQLRNGRRLVTFLAPQRSAAAYLVTRDAARKYLAHILPMRVPFDQEFDKGWRYGIRFRGVVPHPVVSDPRASTIGHGRIKKRWYRRGSVLLYRIGNELRRAHHHLVADRAWMSFRP
jgi:glycosyl transferase family 25